MKCMDNSGYLKNSPAVSTVALHDSLAVGGEGSNVTHREIEQSFNAGPNWVESHLVGMVLVWTSITASLDSDALFSFLEEQS